MNYGFSAAAGGFNDFFAHAMLIPKCLAGITGK